MSDELNVQTNETATTLSRTVEVTIENNGLGINASQTFQSVTVDFAPINVFDNVTWDAIHDKPLGVAGGVATLDANGKVPTEQLPSGCSGSYTDLSNKPSINGETLVGDINSKDLNLPIVTYKTSSTTLSNQGGNEGMIVETGRPLSIWKWDYTKGTHYLIPVKDDCISIELTIGNSPVYVVYEFLTENQVSSSGFVGPTTTVSCSANEMVSIENPGGKDYLYILKSDENGVLHKPKSYSFTMLKDNNKAEKSNTPNIFTGDSAIGSLSSNTLKSAKVGDVVEITPSEGPSVIYSVVSKTDSEMYLVSTQQSRVVTAKYTKGSGIFAAWTYDSLVIKGFDGKSFAGVLTPNSSLPETNDPSAFYMAFETGEYTNFYFSLNDDEIAIVSWNGTGYVAEIQDVSNVGFIELTRDNINQFDSGEYAQASKKFAYLSDGSVKKIGNNTSINFSKVLVSNTDGIVSVGEKTVSISNNADEFGHHDRTDSTEYETVYSKDLADITFIAMPSGGENGQVLKKTDDGTGWDVVNYDDLDRKPVINHKELVRGGDTSSYYDLPVVTYNENVDFSQYSAISRYILKENGVWVWSTGFTLALSYVIKLDEDVCGVVISASQFSSTTYAFLNEDQIPDGSMSPPAPSSVRTGTVAYLNRPSDAAYLYIERNEPNRGRDVMPSNVMFQRLRTSEKADKVANATSGNLAGLDSNGNITDSGVAASGLVTDVTVGGTSVVSSGTAVIPSIPTVPAISTNVVTDKASDTKTSSPKSVYDEIHPAVATTQPSGGMLPNKLYKLGILSGSVTISLASPTDNTIENEYRFTFTADSTAPTITWPNSVTKWIGNSLDNGAPKVEASTYYEVSIQDGYGIFNAY